MSVHLHPDQNGICYQRASVTFSITISLIHNCPVVAPFFLPVITFTQLGSSSVDPEMKCFPLSFGS